MNRIDLVGRKAIVTGGARGIGPAIAERLLASGAEVTLWDLDGAALDAAKGRLASSGQTHRRVVDDTDDQADAAAANAATAAMGTVDVLVNNAGIAGLNKPSWEYPVAEWRRVLDINLSGSFLCSRAIVPVMLAKKYGRIVNIASVAGKEGNPNASAYSASKAAVIGLTKSLGKELAKTGIRVNCVTPAAVRTAIFDQMTPQFIDFMLSKIPMGRFGTVDEIAALVGWLASEDCSFSTGAAFDASGGRATY